jgi:hypothetical protein
MLLGVCALCLKSKDLCKSHIIPNAVFRRIKNNNDSGQLVQLDDSRHVPIQYSQESWWEYLLCKDCERTIRNYESYGLSFLRGGSNAKAYKHSGGVTFRGHVYARFKLFLTSVLWRAAVSKQPHFSKVILPPQCSEAARQSLLDVQPLQPLRLGCKLTRMIDYTDRKDGGFSDENLKEFVISPIPRLFEHAKFYTFLFLFEGFLFEYFVPTIPYKKKSGPGVHRDSAILFVPYESIIEVPELLRLMVSAYGKHDRGLVTLTGRGASAPSLPRSGA